MSRKLSVLPEECEESSVSSTPLSFDDSSTPYPSKNPQNKYTIPPLKMYTGVHDVNKYTRTPSNICTDVFALTPLSSPSPVNSTPYSSETPLNKYAIPPLNIAHTPPSSASPVSSFAPLGYQEKISILPAIICSAIHDNVDTIIANATTDNKYLGFFPAKLGKNNAECPDKNVVLQQTESRNRKNSIKEISVNELDTISPAEESNKCAFRNSNLPGIHIRYVENKIHKNCNDNELILGENSIDNSDHPITSLEQIYVRKVLDRPNQLDLRGRRRNPFGFKQIFQFDDMNSNILIEEKNQHRSSLFCKKYSDTELESININNKNSTVSQGFNSNSIDKGVIGNLRYMSSQLRPLKLSIENCKSSDHNCNATVHHRMEAKNIAVGTSTVEHRNLPRRISCEYHKVAVSPSDTISNHSTIYSAFGSFSSCHPLSRCNSLSPPSPPWGKYSSIPSSPVDSPGAFFTPPESSPSAPEWPFNKM